MPFDDEHFAAALDFNCDSPFSFKENAANGASCAYRKIRPVAGGVQISQSAAPSNTIGIVECHRANSAEAGMIMVGTVRKTRSPARIVERALIRQPLFRLGTRGDYGAAGTMIIGTAEIKIGFELAK